MTKKNGRVITVFGSAGLRDRLKRPVMGEIAARLADITVLTAEDPRTEKAEDIIEQIASGYRRAKKSKLHKLFREPDRQKAINLAISLARPGDVVACLGKSHEKSMCFGKIEYPWSEHQAVLKALKLKKEGK
jgi:UDP-N-acetylmuramoyl-L-alanyl-D-glutamate--2,6-diaminopimelate ligase